LYAYAKGTSMLQCGLAANVLFQMDSGASASLFA
jgi:hypothetical protein